MFDLTVNSGKIIIDTDPDQDDAVAILLALASPEFQVLGMTVADRRGISGCEKSCFFVRDLVNEQFSACCWNVW